MSSNNVTNDQSCSVSPNSNTSTANLKPAGLSRNFSTGAKLDRTQSLRTTTRPLGPFNGPREPRTTEVINLLRLIEWSV